VTRSVVMVAMALGVLACERSPAVEREVTASEPGDAEAAEILPFYDDPYFTAQWLTPEDPRYAKLHRIADFALRDQTGRAFTQADVAGKIHVANFFFTTCPSVCPKMTNHLMRVQAAFLDDDDVVMLSYSVQSWVDDVAMLASYAERHGIDARRWHLLTGEREQIYALARESYFVEKGINEHKPANEFLHTENVVLVDGEGRLRGIYNATLPLDVERMIADIRVLKRGSPG
jgi:protein SCO1/2